MPKRLIPCDFFHFKICPEFGLTGCIKIAMSSGLIKLCLYLVSDFKAKGTVHPTMKMLFILTRTWSEQITTGFFFLQYREQVVLFLQGWEYGSVLG